MTILILKNREQEEYVVDEAGGVVLSLDSTTQIFFLLTVGFDSLGPSSGCPMPGWPMCSNGLPDLKANADLCQE